MKKLIRTSAVALVLTIASLTAACQASDGGRTPAASQPKAAVTSPKVAPKPGTAKTPPARTINPAAYPGCQAVVNTAAAPACTDYLRSAVPARAGYYQQARNPNTAKAQTATKHLKAWYTGSARSLVTGQVNAWDPNYSVDIDVHRTIKVTGGQGAASAGVATLNTVETWRVVTEGGPVLTAQGQPSVYFASRHFTVTLLRFGNGWAVSKIAQS
jgi:hypothetical protein